MTDERKQGPVVLEIYVFCLESFQTGTPTGVTTPFPERHFRQKKVSNQALAQPILFCFVSFSPSTFSRCDGV